MEKTVDLSGYRDVDVKRFKVRSLVSEDMVTAASRCTSNDSNGVDPMVFSVMYTRQQVAQSIIEVDGVKITGPCLSALKWNQRTYMFAKMAFDYVNGLSGKEAEDFQAALEGGSSAESTTPAGSNAG